MKYDLIIKNGTVHTEEGFLQTDVGVVGEKIACIGSLAEAEAVKVIDAAGKYVLPGMIDFHTHIREPGQEFKEDYTTGTMAAAHGGVTAVAVMPNNLTKGIADLETFQYAIKCGEEHAVVDFAPIPSPLGFHKGSVPELAAAGASYFKIMETNNKQPLEENFRCASTWELDQCFAEVAKTGKYVSIHPMDMDWYLGNVAKIKASDEPQDLMHVLHQLYGEEEMCSAAWQLAYFFRKNKCKWIAVHCWHRGYNDLIRMLKKTGGMDILASLEFLPSSIRNFDTLYNRNDGSTIALGHAAKPDWDYIWEAVADGTIDYFGSDHSPHMPENYHPEDPFASAQGVVGEDYYGNLLLDAVNAGKLTMERLVEVTSINGAKALGWTEKCGNVIGTDADFTICDMNKVWTVDETYPIYSKPNLDPLWGQEMRGKVTHTIVRGKVVMEEDKILADAGYGKFIKA